MRPQLPDYGAYLKWPESGEAWIHPEDVAIVAEVIPSDRVFVRESFDGMYYLLRYGDSIAFRARPALWLPIQGEGLDVGDQVEISGLGMLHEPGIVRITEMRFLERTRRIQYTVISADCRLHGNFFREDLIQLTRKDHLREGDVGHPLPRWRNVDGEPGLPFD